MDRVREDVALKSLYTGERQMDRSAITGRFPVIRPTARPRATSLRGPAGAGRRRGIAAARTEPRG